MNHHQIKRAVYHARARAFEDAAREIELDAATGGLPREDAAKLAARLRGWAEAIREEADSAFSTINEKTLGEVFEDLTTQH